VIALAAVAVAVGALVGVLMLQRLAVGETWDDWVLADSPAWFTALQVALVAMFIGGFFAPAELAAVLIGVPGGFCLAFLTIGIRRRFGARTRPAARGPVDEELEHEIERELDEELRESWRSRAGWFAATLAVSFGTGYLIVDLRGFELVAVAVGLAIATTIGELIRERFGRWLAGR
jgi:hypothetical protein